MERSPQFLNQHIYGARIARERKRLASGSPTNFRKNRASSPPSPSPPKRRRGGFIFRARYPGWRSFLAYPGLLSETPGGVLEMARTACAEPALRVVAGL